MEDIIRTGNSCQNVFIACEVAPDDCNGRITGIAVKLSMILPAVAGQKAYIESVLSFLELLKTGPAHIAGAACQKYCSLFHYLSVLDQS